jgi:fluoride ion exporter CrcB/FEX
VSWKSYISSSPWPLIKYAGLALYTLGGGFGTFARSLVSSLVEPKMVGTLYTTISIMDTLGSLLAGPLVSTAFSLGSNLGGMWQGIPFLFACGLCTIATALMLRVRLHKSDVGYQNLGTGDMEDYSTSEKACNGASEQDLEEMDKLLPEHV